MDKYYKVINTLNEFKINIEDDIKKYSNEILPRVLNFEKTVVPNSYIPYLSVNDIDEFIENSSVMYEYKQPILITKKTTGIIPNNLDTNVNVKYDFELYYNVYNLNASALLHSLKINSINIKNTLKLNSYHNLKLYFDDEYKKQIIKYDTDINTYVNADSIHDGNKDDEKNENKFLCVSIYTNYNFMINLQLLNVKKEQKIIYDDMLDDYNECIESIYRNILYGDNINFNQNISTINKTDYKDEIYETYEKLPNILEVQFVNLSNNDKLTFNEQIDELKLSKFMENCKHELHPKIIIDYLKTKQINEIKEFFNQIDNYTKFENESIIEEKNNQIKEQENEILKLKNEILLLNKMKTEHNEINETNVQ